MMGTMQRRRAGLLPTRVDTMNLRRKLIIAVFLGLGAATCYAQSDRGTVVRVASMYISPDTTSAKLGEVERGHDVAVLETSGKWAHVEAAMTQDKVLTGWIDSKGLILPSTANGDRILFGEAVDSEDQASQRHGRRDAAQDAMRLYFRITEIFPNSPLAGEALYRAADIRWQLDKPDVTTLPSSRNPRAPMHAEVNDEFMKQVMKKYPGTKWADLAAFHLIDNKLCSDWEGSVKCPEKEADAYEKYANDHPQSPALAEALYDAAYRRAALIEMYKTDNEQKKSDESRVRAMSLAQKAAQSSTGDWGARAQRLLYSIQEGIPTYGNAEP